MYSWIRIYKRKNSLKYEIRGDRLVVFGNLLYPDGKPNIGCLVIVEEMYTSTILGKTTTDTKGNYFLSTPLERVPSSTYILKTYGSKSRPYLKPLGDWETFFIDTGLGSDLLPPDFTLISGIE